MTNPFLERIRAESGELIGRVSAAVLEHAPEGMFGPAEGTAFAEFALEQLLRPLPGAPLGEEELRAFEDFGLGCAVCGVSIDRMRVVLEAGAATMLGFVSERAGPEDLAVLQAVLQRSAAETRTAITHAEAGYLRWGKAAFDTFRQRREAASCLLRGERPADQRWAPAGPVLVALVPGAAPGEDGLERMAGGLDGDVLMAVHPAGAVLLAPLVGGLPADERERERLARGRAEHLAAGCAPDRPLGCAVAAEPAAVPPAVRAAERSAELAWASGLSSSAAFPADVCLEEALAQDAEARGRLRSLLDALGGHGVLTETLGAFYSCELDRSRTARALGVHRGTVAKRLERVAEVTGVHPASTLGVQLFAAALTERRLDREEGYPR